MITQTLTPLGDNIFLIEDVLSSSTCQHIIDIADSCQFESAGILVNAVDDQVRHNDILSLNESQPLLSSTNQLLLSHMGIVQQLLFQEYGVRFPYAEPFSILRYSSGEFYKRHVDNLLLASRFQEIEQGIPTRDVSVVGYLNDGFAGGETYFDRQNVTVIPKAGAVLVFPSYFTHPHQSLTVTQGRKYAFTTWLFH